MMTFKPISMLIGYKGFLLRGCFSDHPMKTSPHSSLLTRLRPSWGERRTRLRVYGVRIRVQGTHTCTAYINVYNVIPRYSRYKRNHEFKKSTSMHRWLALIKKKGSRDGGTQACTAVRCCTHVVNIFAHTLTRVQARTAV